MRRCYGAMRWCYVTIAPSHRRIVHRIASSSIASPHRPSHRLIVHRIASSCITSSHRASHRPIASSVASPHRPSHRRNASVTLLGHHTKAAADTFRRSAFTVIIDSLVAALQKRSQAYEWISARFGFLRNVQPMSLDSGVARGGGHGGHATPRTFCECVFSPNNL